MPLQCFNPFIGKVKRDCETNGLWGQAFSMFQFLIGKVKRIVKKVQFNLNCSLKFQFLIGKVKLFRQKPGYVGTYTVLVSIPYR